jgi:hypothetical protein
MLTFCGIQCVVVRQDKRPLKREVIETIIAFHAKLLNAVGFPECDGWAPTKDLMNPATFQMFSRDYYKEQSKKSRPGFDAFFTPL